jgi:hypothetical protein
MEIVTTEFGSRVQNTGWGLGAPLRLRYRTPKSFDTLGNHPRHFGLVVCNLSRAVSVVALHDCQRTFDEPARRRRSHRDREKKGRAGDLRRCLPWQQITSKPVQD